MNNIGTPNPALALGHSGEWWDTLLFAFAILAAIAAIGIGVSTGGSVTAHKREARLAEQKAAQLTIQLEETKNAGKQIDANLLHEQRLTANERWRLERIERAVLPRSNFINWNQLVADLRAGNFEPINLGVPRAPWEANDFGDNLAAALQAAGLLKMRIDLPPSTSEFVPVGSGGAAWFVVNDRANRFGEMLWQKYRIGGGPSTFSLLPPEWTMLPTNENCLIVGENGAAMGPGDGQAGEGLDPNGRPVPAP